MSNQTRTRLEIRADPALAPNCPYCETPLAGIRAKQIEGVGPGTFRFGKRFAYACPNCNKLLGITHRKGFWMG